MKMVVIIALPAALLLVAMAAWLRFAVASGGSIGMFGSNAKAQEVRMVEVAHAPTLVLDSEGGSVQLTGGGDGAIRVDAEKHAPTKEEADKMTFTVDNRENTIYVRYNRPDDHHGNRYIDFKIEAPRDTVLDVTTGGGNIAVFGFSHGVQARTGGGDVRVADVSGDLRVDTGGGNIHCGGVDGAVDLNTGGGNIDATGSVSGRAALTTGGGDINIQSVDGVLKAQTGSGNVSAGGRLAGASEVSSGSGNVRVVIPPDSGLEIRASTGSGDIHDDFGIASSMAQAGGATFLTGQIGSGSSTLAVQTGNGNVAIEKG